MRSPLKRRLPRELKAEWAKYGVIFLFLAGMIAIVSGFLVASGSMLTAYEEAFEKYNIEDGNFEYMFQADSQVIEQLEAEQVRIYENFYVEQETDSIDSTLRVYQNREEINQVCVMEGSLAQQENEIAIDRMYADNNKLSVGDVLSVQNRELTITGLVALSDYSALYSGTEDMIFDAIKFGVAIVTEEGFASMGDKNLHFNYSWKYDQSPKNKTQEKEMSEEFLETLVLHGQLVNFIPQYMNQAIVFAGDDMGRDHGMIVYFLYIIVAILAFIFAITTSNTIEKEATVIGTLRASGYTKGELLAHYITMPVLVIIVSAVIGNILGYTWLKDVAADMYYHTYSLPTYVTLWNMDAFVLTTAIPVVLMIVINGWILVNKLSLSPQKFMRRDLRKKSKKKAFRLSTKIPIMKRFRIRILFQNMPNYITLIVGIFLANVILLFGAAMNPLFEQYEKDITSNMICDYQYVLKNMVETDTEGAEPYSIMSLETMEGRYKSEGVTVFGVKDHSEYLSLAFDSEQVYISSAYAEKYEVSKGDTIELKEKYSDKKYKMQVKGVYEYPAGISVFMGHDAFCSLFEKEEAYYNGYFSNVEITDVDERMIATKITRDDLTKTSRQMKHSMGILMDLMFGFGVIMFLLIIYLLSKIIIEKNAQSISMAKILGYKDLEICSLYILSTSIVVVGAFLLTIPLVNIMMKEVFRVVFSQYAGWLPYYVPVSVLIKIAVTGIGSYFFIVWGQFRKVQGIPLQVALKNVE